MKKFAGFIVFLIFFNLVFAQSLLVNSKVVNRKALVQYIHAALQQLKGGDFRSAENIVEIALKFDDSVADLYFIKAQCATANHAKKGEIIEIMERAFNNSEWILVDEKDARVFFAQYLFEVRRFDDALKFLNAEPHIYSADADFLRIKNLYALGQNEEALSFAKTAVSIFRDDARFPILFLQNADETNLSEKEAIFVGNILRNITTWSDANPEIFLFVAPFCPDEEMRRNFLLAYKAAVSNPIAQFYISALRFGVIDENDAFNYFAKTAGAGIDFETFKSFVSLIRTDEMRGKIETFLNYFSGEMSFNGGAIVADYEIGRPSTIKADGNTDGFLDWESSCDFGMPASTFLHKQRLTVKYGIFPMVREVSNEETSYEVVDESLDWSPFLVQNIVLSPLQTEFFVPVLAENVLELSEKILIENSSKVISNLDKNGRKAEFVMHDKKIQTAKYFENDALFAIATFDNGILKTRDVDKNGDGFFEVEEIYTFSPENFSAYQNANENAQLKAELFGDFKMQDGLYLQKVCIDLTQDGHANFIEEYLPNNGKISYWGVQEDGSWQIRYICENDKERVLERCEFVNPLTFETVALTFENGMPQVFADERGIVRIIPDSQYPIFWLNEQADAETAKKIMTESKLQSPNVAIVTADDGTQFLAFFSGNSFYAEAISKK